MSGRLSVGTRRRMKVRKLALLATMTTAMKMIVVPSVTMVRLPPSAFARMSSSWKRRLATSESTSSGTSTGRPIDSAQAWNAARSPVSSSTIEGPPSITSVIESAKERATSPVARIRMPATPMSVRAAAEPRGSLGKWFTSHVTMGSRRKASSQPRKNMIAICRNGGHMSRMSATVSRVRTTGSRYTAAESRPLSGAEVQTVDQGGLVSRAIRPRMIRGVGSDRTACVRVVARPKGPPSADRWMRSRSSGDWRCRRSDPRT